MGKKIKVTSESQNTSRTFSIPNKVHRQAHNIRLKTALGTEKRKLRAERKNAEEKDPSLREERLRNNIPDTIERKRVWDERIDGATPADVKRSKTQTEGREAETTDDGIAEELAALEAHEKEQGEQAEAEETYALFPTLSMPPPTSVPRILVTTSRNSHIHAPAEEITAVLPNATYVPRGSKFSIKDICKFASAPTTIDAETGEQREPFSHVIVVNEDRKLINALTIVVLPAGPTFRFGLSNFTPCKKIGGHANPTSHTPELILNNFLTPLGKVAAGLFQGMFPRLPEFEGRQVVTLHNQRDYIFFRRHRYVFREKRETEKEAGYGLDDGGKDGGNGSKGTVGLGVRVGLQEIGPRFTLKLRKVERGIKEEVVWEWKAGMEKDRRKFQL